jgi:site-specific DNA-adenine methylase
MGHIYDCDTVTYIAVLKHKRGGKLILYDPPPYYLHADKLHLQQHGEQISCSDHQDITDAMHKHRI